MIRRRLKISQIALSMGDAPFGTSLKTKDYEVEGVPVVQGKNINGRSCDWSDMRFVSDEKFSSLPRSHVRVGDLVFPKVGTIGKVGILTSFKDHNKYLLSTNTMKLEVDPEIANHDYVYYYFSSRSIRNYINQISSKSVQPVFNFTSLRNFEILLPPLLEQHRIAEILGALDDKIELNLEMNKTLEEMAMLLYKRWFVDFEFPNEEGKPYKSSGGEFVDSELGMIPKGWKSLKLPALSINHNKLRQPLSSRERVTRGGKYPYYGATGILDHIDEYRFDGTYLLVAEDGTVKTVRNTPYTQYIQGRFWVSNHAHVLTGNEGYSTEYINLALSSKDVGPYITGAVQPKLNKGNLNSMSFAVSQKYSTRLHVAVKPLFDLILNNQAENIQLERLRNLLLPKLISGEIQVKDAENQVKDVL
ncbi:restriction endonuclease subunit S [Bacteroidota bacterium]